MQFNNINNYSHQWLSFKDALLGKTSEYSVFIVEPSIRLRICSMQMVDLLFIMINDMLIINDSLFLNDCCGARTININKIIMNMNKT